IADCHHPNSAGKYVPSAMMLEPSASSILIRVASKVWQNEQSRFAGVFRFALYRLPKFSAQAVGTPDALYIERVCPGMGDINIMHSDPQQAGCLLPHQLTHNI